MVIRFDDLQRREEPEGQIRYRNCPELGCIRWPSPNPTIISLVHDASRGIKLENLLDQIGLGDYMSK